MINQQAANTLNPFTMYTAFPCSDYYEFSVPPHLHQPATSLPQTPRQDASAIGGRWMVPTFILQPFDGVGAQLCPCNIDTATPQAFTMTSRPATSTNQRVPKPDKPIRCALLHSPDLSDSSCWVS